METWRDYFEDFIGRASRIPADTFDRNRLLYEAAHDTYQEVTDGLTNLGMDAEQALMLGRTFSAVVKKWIDGGAKNENELEDELALKFS
jgi:hypothetical protein